VCGRSAALIIKIVRIGIQNNIIIIIITYTSNYDIPTTYIPFLLVNSLQKLAYYEHWQSLFMFAMTLSYISLHQIIIITVKPILNEA